ncbi:type II toxin-antitoxin system RelE/ParE family toxin [Rhizobium mesosinicum]|uniref:Type II toxin-antitoxin system RelE/ParE family toxin n=1 Tax=Rhizobium mesosinicum TaxID=335017 RepID=A0ABS7GNB9_9HYPH|nr:type II toxin-antitoxin system RelE/ParE family toxin [Rhizobium mesosinicum]
MTAVRLSKDVASYIRREGEYLRKLNPAAARKFALAIKNAKRTLSEFPQSGNRCTAACRLPGA